MPDLILRRFNSGNPDKSWSLEIRRHDCPGEVEYERIALVSEAQAREIERSGAPYFLHGKPDSRPGPKGISELTADVDLNHSICFLLYRRALENAGAFAVTEAHRHEDLRDYMSALEKKCQIAIRSYLDRKGLTRNDVPDNTIAGFVSNFVGQAALDEQWSKRADLWFESPIDAALRKSEAPAFSAAEFHAAGVFIEPVIDDSGLWRVSIDHDVYRAAMDTMDGLFPDLRPSMAATKRDGREIMACYLDSAADVVKRAMQIAIAAGRVPNIHEFDDGAAYNDRILADSSGIWGSTPTEHFLIAAHTDGRLTMMRNSTPADAHEFRASKLGRGVLAAWDAGMALKAERHLRIRAQATLAAAPAP